MITPKLIKHTLILLLLMNQCFQVPLYGNMHRYYHQIDYALF